MKEKEIQNKILKYLEKQEWPVTTEEVAKSINISWNTAQLHLIKLQMQNKVKFKRVGRQNQWWLNKNYKKGWYKNDMA
ncbi:MAG: FaeA/PapI family transcriptional regulator [Candidatus Micrarchaeia archaeon]